MKKKLLFVLFCFMQLFMYLYAEDGYVLGSVEDPVFLDVARCDSTCVVFIIYNFYKNEISYFYLFSNLSDSECIQFAKKLQLAFYDYEVDQTIDHSLAKAIMNTSFYDFILKNYGWPYIKHATFELEEVINETKDWKRYNYVADLLE